MLLSDADRIRKEYKELNSKLSNIGTKISDLEKKLEQDFGNTLYLVLLIMCIHSKFGFLQYVHIELKILLVPQGKMESFTVFMVNALN